MKPYYVTLRMFIRKEELESLLNETNISEDFLQQFLIEEFFKWAGEEMKIPGPDTYEIPYKFFGVIDLLKEKDIIRWG